jgi:hypothetical protein
MAKGIIVFFFIVAVGLYSLVRYAKVGIGAAREYVNTNVIEHVVTPSAGQGSRSTAQQAELNIVEIATRLLSTQLAFMDDENGKAAAGSDDVWSCGYVVGFCGGLQRAAGISDETTCLDQIFAVMSGLFGLARGPQRAMRYFENQQDAVAQAGGRAGLEDIYAWLRDTQKPPMAWAVRVNGWSRKPARA